MGSPPGIFDSWWGQGFFSSPSHPDWVWSPHTLPFKGSYQNIKLTTHHQPVPQLRIYGTSSPPHYIPSCHDAYAQGQLLRLL